MGKKCSIEGCERVCWSGSVCLWHTPKVGIKKKPYKLKRGKKIAKISKKGEEKKAKKKEYTEKQFKMFEEIWQERPHYCFESGQFLGYEALSTMFHHCLYKSVYPQFALNKENIVLITPNIHQLTHISIDKTPKIKEYTQELRNKWLK